MWQLGFLCFLSVIWVREPGSPPTFLASDEVYNQLSYFMGSCVFWRPARSQKWPQLCLYQMERERSLLKEGLGCLTLNEGGQGISSAPFVPGRFSGSICGYDPLTLESSWALELSIHSVDSSFILLVTKASGSLFPTPPAMSTIHESLSVPLPGTLHLEKYIWWTHNVNSGNERHLSNVSIV